MKSQILDEKKIVVSTKETSQSDIARVTYARVKYFSHNSALPKSEIISVPQMFKRRTFHFFFPHSKQRRNNTEIALSEQ